VGTALHSLGICYHLQRKFAEAQTCYERALKIEGRVMGVGHPEYASTLYLLAKVLSLQGKRRDAESLTEESIRILEEAGLGESPTCIQRMTYLSTVSSYYEIATGSYYLFFLEIYAFMNVNGHDVFVKPSLGVKIHLYTIIHSFVRW